MQNPDEQLPIDTFENTTENNQKSEISKSAPDQIRPKRMMLQRSKPRNPPVKSLPKR